MTLEQAIDILIESQLPKYPNYFSDYDDAVALAIEALKLYKQCHLIACRMAESLLPGETEE